MRRAAALRVLTRPDAPQPERNIADDVIADFEAGLEYASATRIIERRRGAVTEYLVEVRPVLAASLLTLAQWPCLLLAQWDDGEPPTWEIEDHISAQVMQEFLDRTAQAKPMRRNVSKAPKALEPASV